MAAYELLRELSRGTNAFEGSTKGKWSIANRPQGAYGKLQATRSGEYVVLDSTRLDVFAMEPVTCRWVQCELSVAMDLYSRCITGLRLTPVSTKSVDIAGVTVLLACDLAAHVSLDNPDTVSRLVTALREAGAVEQVTALARRIAARVGLSNPGAVGTFLWTLREAGADKEVTALLARHPAAHASLDDPAGLARLLEVLRKQVRVAGRRAGPPPPLMPASTTRLP